MDLLILLAYKNNSQLMKKKRKNVNEVKNFLESMLLTASNFLCNLKTDF